MQNPLLGQEPLPQFLKIRPEHVEPAVRELLSQNRARLEELATQQQPTFASVVEPMEELQHRISRTWSGEKRTSRYRPSSMRSTTRASSTVRSATRNEWPDVVGSRCSI